MFIELGCNEKRTYVNTNHIATMQVERMADGTWKGVLTLVTGDTRQVTLSSDAEFQYVNDAFLHGGAITHTPTIPAKFQHE